MVELEEGGDEVVVAEVDEGPKLVVLVEVVHEEELEDDEELGTEEVLDEDQSSHELEEAVVDGEEGSQGWPHGRPKGS